MSLNSRINSAVNRAFTAAGDLVQKGKLTGKTVSDYDFTTRTTTSKTFATKTIDLIITTESKSRSENTINVIFKTIDLTNYTTLTIGTDAYRIASFTDNGFVIEASLVKEL